jgi:hypothetical protein
VSHIDGFPLPPTARHDADGNHVRPHIPEWRRAAESDPDRVVRGSEVARDQRQKAVFVAHLNEHHRRGESIVVIENEEEEN